MNENTNGKTEVTYVEPTVPTTEETVVTYIGSGVGAKTRYGIAWTVPTSDEQAKELYDCSLADLIGFGVKNFCTKPNYQSVGFDEYGNLVDGGHEAMQRLADEYKVGARRAGEGQKKKLARLESENAELANTVDAMKAELARLKELAGE